MNTTRQKKLQHDYQRLTHMLLLLLAIGLASLGSVFFAQHILSLAALAHP